MYPPQRLDLIDVGPMRQFHRRVSELGGVVCVHGLSGLIWFRQTACYVCMCKEMWAGAGYVSDLTDILGCYQLTMIAWWQLARWQHAVPSQEHREPSVSLDPVSQQRSWPMGSRGPNPPELLSGVHAKCKHPVIIFFVEGEEGAGVGG